MHNKKPIFEVLRASAVLMVVFGHFSTSAQDFPSLVKDIVFSISCYGVPLFFIISGFLLSASFCSLLHNNGKLLPAVKIFYIKRVLRIYPAYLVSLVVLSIYYNSSYFDFFVHLFNIHNLFEGCNRNINDVYWTLAVEFQWYIIAPVIIFISEKKAPWLLLAILLSSMIVRFYIFTDYFEKSISFSSVIRLGHDQLYIHLFNFYIGVVVYKFRKIQFNLPHCLLYCLFVILIFLGYLQRDFVVNITSYRESAVQDKFIINYMSIFILGFFVHSLLNIKIKKEANLYWKIVSMVSFVSYSLYIYHYPVLRYISSFHFQWYFSLLAYISLSLLVSALSYYCIEKFFLAYSSRIRPSNYN